MLAILASLFASTTQAAPSAATLEQAGNLFAITCSSSFCHGEGGVGGRGPSLRNRNFTPDFVRTTITNGRSGTPMPSFKDSLAQPEMDLIVAYVMSLSPNNQNADAVAPAAAVPVSTPAAPLSAQAEAGRRLFFDLSHPGSCAACHSYKEEGGPIGPDLSKIAGKSPNDIYQSIVKPAAANPDYPVVAFGTKDKPVPVIFKQKTDKVVQFYDLSSTPPVLRSFYAYTIGMAPDVPTSYAHDLSGYSKDELADVIAFLKCAAGPSKDVTAQDLAP